MGKGRQIRRSDAREIAKRLAADPRMVASFNSEGVRTARPVPPRSWHAISPRSRVRWPTQAFRS